MTDIDKHDWRKDFDREYSGVICDGAGIQDQSTREDIKDFIQFLLDKAKAEQREEDARLAEGEVKKWDWEDEGVAERHYKIACDNIAKAIRGAK